LHSTQSRMNTKEYAYSWHLSLRVDRPVEGCAVRPHAYMYGKKLDDREADKPLPPHSKKMREPPPNHEFSYRWFRGPSHEPCAYEGCPRRTSFSPHDWSMHALGGSGCSLQCVSTQSSLYKCTFCNSTCFVNAWKTQYTVPKEMRQQSRSNTPLRQRSGSFGSNVDDDARSVGSAGSVGRMNGSKSPANVSDAGSTFSAASQPGTPRGYVGSYNNSANTDYSSGDFPQGEEWVEISRDQLHIPGPEDIGKKLKLEAAAYSSETGELLMHRVVKTDLVLARAPDPVKRPIVTSKNTGGGGGGARFRMMTYNVLAEIYATQQQYPYCDLWALSWDYRCVRNKLRTLLAQILHCSR
jgi:CCR4-NOT transcription complex subunit 6